MSGAAVHPYFGVYSVRGCNIGNFTSLDNELSGKPAVRFRSIAECHHKTLCNFVVNKSMSVFRATSVFMVKAFCFSLFRWTHGFFWHASSGETTSSGFCTMCLDFMSRCTNYDNVHFIPMPHIIFAETHFWLSRLHYRCNNYFSYSNISSKFYNASHTLTEMTT